MEGGNGCLPNKQEICVFCLFNRIGWTAPVVSISFALQFRWPIPFGQDGQPGVTAGESIGRANRWPNRPRGGPGPTRRGTLPNQWRRRRKSCWMRTTAGHWPSGQTGGMLKRFRRGINRAFWDSEKRDRGPKGQLKWLDIIMQKRILFCMWILKNPRFSDFLIFLCFLYSLRLKVKAQQNWEKKIQMD
jgi:hypothetical protein